MDKLTQYRTFIQDIMEEYAAMKPSYGNVEMEFIADTQRDHY
jgi:hypothetical protein